MRIIAVSISHERAPVKIREKVYFTKRKQVQMLDYIKRNIASECVILSTCNRCEFYLAGENMLGKFLAYLISLTDADMADYIDLYEDADCCKHLMLTASGLKSMILGEDQILGQVKEAHEFALQHRACGKYLNMLFRIAVTGAKKVKTQTLLSQTPLSAATISIKLCQKILGTLNNKNILIIGASGKTGSIILKDLLSLKCANIYITSRSHGGTINEINEAVTVDYDRRYEQLDIYDAVISSTSSPHIVLQSNKISCALKTKKKRAFIDLAVPRDIDITPNKYSIYKNIDDLLEIAENNNKIKIREADKAKRILTKYIDEFLIRKLFTDERAALEKEYEDIETENQKIYFRHKIYNLRAENDYDKCLVFIKSLREK